LFGPAEREIDPLRHCLGCKLDRLIACQYRRNDLGRDKCQRNRVTYVTPRNTLALRDLGVGFGAPGSA
jgi:hypothetical protein